MQNDQEAPLNSDDEEHEFERGGDREFDSEAYNIDDSDEEAELAAASAAMMEGRFRGYLPVIVDIETGGFNASTDAILEIGAVIPCFNAAGELETEQTFFQRIVPFEGANLEEAALKFTGIDPFHPLRIARPEKECLRYAVYPDSPGAEIQPLQTCHPRRTQRPLRSRLHQRSHCAARPQTQSVSSVLEFRYREPERSRLRPNGTRAGLRIRGNRLR